MTGAVAHPDPGSRWHRQEILPWFGAQAQGRLRGAHAAIVGCGALGCAQADLLARAGIGRLTLVDRDVVERTNLQRQTLYTEDDAQRGVAKATAAAARVRAIDSSVEVRGWCEDLVAENALDLLAGADVIVDGLDGFETRYLLNDVAVSRGIPYVYCGAVAARCMTMPVLPGDGPCLRCVFDEPPAPGVEATCDTAGAFGPAIFVAAGLAAANAIRLCAGLAGHVDRALVSVDLAGGAGPGAAGAAFTRTALAGARRADCACCGARRFEWLSGVRAESATTLCGRNAVQIRPARAAQAPGATPTGGDAIASLAQRLRALGEVRIEQGVLHATPRDERTRAGTQVELAVFADGRAIVRGTSDPDEARRIHARLVGS